MIVDDGVEGVEPCPDCLHCLCGCGGSFEWGRPHCQEACCLAAPSLEQLAYVVLYKFLRSAEASVAEIVGSASSKGEDSYECGRAVLRGFMLVEQLSEMDPSVVRITCLWQGKLQWRSPVLPERLSARAASGLSTHCMQMVQHPYHNW